MFAFFHPLLVFWPLRAAWCGAEFVTRRLFVSDAEGGFELSVNSCIDLGLYDGESVLYCRRILGYNSNWTLEPCLWWLVLPKQMQLHLLLKDIVSKHFRVVSSGSCVVSRLPRLTWEIKRGSQFHQRYITVVAPVVVFLVVDDLFDGVSRVLSHFGRAAGDNTGVDHPAGYLR